MQFPDWYRLPADADKAADGERPTGDVWQVSVQGPGGWVPLGTVPKRRPAPTVNPATGDIR